jgi:repressor LexA
MKPLSDVQQRMLDAIRSYVQENDCPPTLREIQRAARLSSTSHVDYHLGQLESKGWIRRTPGVSRGVEVIPDSESRRRTTFVNVQIRGTIAAGEPIQAVDAPEDMPLTPSFAKVGDYALRVKGDSMIDDHIADGDIVVVRPQAQIDDGDPVVALILDGQGDLSGEATLKDFYFERPRSSNKRGRIRLQPRNATMRPIYVDPDQVQIQGKVIGLIRLMASARRAAGPRAKRQAAVQLALKMPA